MKKILTILTVALLACTTVFAAVNFSGSSTIGYQFNYGHVADKWTQLFYGDDGDDTDVNTLKANISDENGIWSVGIKTGFNSKEATLDNAGSMGGNVTIDFAKLFGLEDWKLTAGMVGNGRYTTLRAYTNQAGNDFDRIRTADNSYVAWVGVGYGGFVEVQLAADPGLNGNSDNPDLKADGEDYGNTKFDDAIVTTSDFLASALVTPIDGVKVSVDYALKGDGAGDGLFGAAADINLGSLLDLDFSVGVSVADKYDFTKGNTIAATVYGGVDLVSVSVEYAYDTTHHLHVGADLNVVENLLLNAYVGASSLAAFGDSFYVGGNVGYVLSGMTFNVGIEYSAPDAAKEFDLSGFNIVPSVSFSW